MRHKGCESHRGLGTESRDTAFPRQMWPCSWWSREQPDGGRGPWSPCPGGQPLLLLPPPPPRCFIQGCPAPAQSSWVLYVFSGFIFKSVQWGLGPRGLPTFLQHLGSGIYSRLLSRNSGSPPQPLSTEAISLPWRPQKPSPASRLEHCPAGSGHSLSPVLFFPYTALGLGGVERKGGC